MQIATVHFDAFLSDECVVFQKWVCSRLKMIVRAAISKDYLQNANFP